MAKEIRSISLEYEKRTLYKSRFEKMRQYPAMIRKILKPLVLLLFSGLFMFGLMEGTLRLLGYQPFKPIISDVHVKSYRLDSELGWKLVPGSYEVGPFNDIGDMMSITIKKDTGRVTRTSNLGVSEEQVVFIGGSFFMGHALDDDETMAWKIQEHFPHLDFRNLAVSAYGTYQSLLVLENEIKRGQKLKSVIYGAFEHHELRNVAEGNWLMELRRKIPYVTLLNDSTLERHRLRKMYRLRLTTKLATAFLAEKVLNRTLSYSRVKDAKRVSYLLMKEMADLCKRHGITFYVAPLQYSPKAMQDLASYLDEQKIHYIDCNVKLTLDNIIKDDGHPGESVNDAWVERISNRLNQDGIAN